jgi:ubiquinone/menaquinone biosynthesis C-methylase UbiE
LQAQPQNLFGVDLMRNRVKVAGQMSPRQSHFLVGNICSLPFTPNHFDLVCSFTVFSSILDYSIRQQAANQIETVLKPGGWLLWYDFHQGTSSTTRGVPLPEVDRLLGGLQRVALYSLHPYRAAAFARRSLFLCEVLDRMPFFPRTHWLALYQKN